jgi:hypothetical protein
LTEVGFNNDDENGSFFLIEVDKECVYVDMFFISF